MRKRTKKWYGIGSCVLAVSVFITGCGGASNNESASPSGGANASTPAQQSVEPDAKPVTLRFAWWGSDVRHKATLEAIDAYTKLNPHVTIEGEYQGYDGYQQKLMTQIAGNSAPDIMQLDYPWLPDLSVQGDIFVDLSQESAIDLTQFPQKILDEYSSVNGKLVALPMGTNGFGSMINKAFMDKHGLSTDTHWTWDKLIEEGERVNKADKSQYLLSIEPSSLSGFILDEYLYSKNGSYWLTDDPAIAASKEDIAEALTVMQRVFDSGAAQPLGDAALFSSKMEQNPKWINAEMGLTLDWSSTVGKYKTAAGEANFAVGKPIIVEGGQSQAIKTKPSMLVGVSKNSPHQDEAVKFINWLLNSEESALILLDTRSVPTSDIAKRALVDAGKIDTDIAEMVDNTLQSPATPPPLVLNNLEVADIIRDVCEKVVYHKLTPEAGAEQLMQRLQDKFEDLK